MNNTPFIDKPRVYDPTADHRAKDKRFFGGNREAAIQRDGEKCVGCGISRDEHRVKYRRDLTVDHIDGLGINTPKHLKNNALSNLQTLCCSCHGKKDIQRRKSVRGLSLEIARKIREEYAAGGVRQIDLANKYGVKGNMISAIVLFKHFKEDGTGDTRQQLGLTGGKG